MLPPYVNSLATRWHIAGNHAAFCFQFQLFCANHIFGQSWIIDKFHSYIWQPIISLLNISRIAETKQIKHLCNTSFCSLHTEATSSGLRHRPNVTDLMKWPQYEGWESMSNINVLLCFSNSRDSQYRYKVTYTIISLLENFGFGTICKFCLSFSTQVMNMFWWLTC